MRIKSLKRKQLPSIKLEAEAKVNEGYFRTDSEERFFLHMLKLMPIYQSGVASSKIRETENRFCRKRTSKTRKKKV